NSFSRAAISTVMFGNLFRFSVTFARFSAKLKQVTKDGHISLFFDYCARTRRSLPSKSQIDGATRLYWTGAERLDQYALESRGLTSIDFGAPSFAAENSG